MFYFSNFWYFFPIIYSLSRSAALLFNFLFTFTYLLYGYYLTQVDASYTITWTMPQCVLALRLIAISFDLYDGEANKEADGEKKKVSA